MVLSRQKINTVNSCFLINESLLFTIDTVSRKQALEKKNSSLIKKNSFPIVFSVPGLRLLSYEYTREAKN